MSEKNIDRLLGLLKHRLQSAEKQKSFDDSGNVVYVDCDIFSDELLKSFLTLSLSDFNQIPYFTEITFDDDVHMNVFAEVLVEGATLQALASQALIERGREFSFSDTGINFQPPSLAELLNTQFSALLTTHFEKLKLIKVSAFHFEKPPFKKS